MCGVNIQDLLVLFCAWDGLLTNSFLVTPSLLLQERESVSYYCKRRVYCSEACMSNLGDAG